MPGLMSLSGEKYELRAAPETFQYFGRSGTNLALLPTVESTEGNLALEEFIRMMR